MLPRLGLAILCLLLPGLVHGITFENISESAGFEPGHLDSDLGGGIAVADFNGNGYPDVFVTGGEGFPNNLYYNQGDGTFDTNPVVNGQIQGENCSVAAAADFNNNGWPDIYVACKWADNHLFENQEGEGFEDVIPDALQHNVECCVQNRTDALAWADLTGNGYLDLYMGIFHASADMEDPDNLDRIMLNNGDGTWTNAAEAMDPEKLFGQALAVVLTDLTGNGRPDIYLVNDKLYGNYLFSNDGPGCEGWCFSDISEETGTDLSVYGMGIAVGDVNRNGLWDLYFSSIDEQHLLYGVSDDPLEFEEDADSPLNHFGVGWSTIFSDFNNNGWEDAFLAVGSGPFSDTDDTDQLLRNLEDGSFEVATEGSGLDTDQPTQSAARIDLQRDGRTDLVLHHWNQTPGYALYRNTSGDPGNWMGFRLQGGGGVNRDAIGTRVIVETEDGGVQRRELRAGEARGVSHDRVLHFGLGEVTSADVTIRWPDGLEQDLGTMGGCRYHFRAHPEAEEVLEDGISRDRFESC